MCVCVCVCGVCVCERERERGEEGGCTLFHPIFFSIFFFILVFGLCNISYHQVKRLFINFVDLVLQANVFFTSFLSSLYIMYWCFMCCYSQVKDIPFLPRNLFIFTVKYTYAHCMHITV